MEKETVTVIEKDGKQIQIALAEHAGFCFGVARALNRTEEAVEAYRNSGRRIYTCGSLIHNKIVTDELLEKGVAAINRPQEAEQGAVVVVRAHGEPKVFYDMAQERGLEIVDATCPFVKRVQQLAKKGIRSSS